MIDLLLGGIGLGLMLSFVLGPIFFVLLDTSIKKGVRAALYLDLGVILSDLMYIYVAYSFVSLTNFEDSDNSKYLTVIGGVIFILFGIFTLRKKVKIPKEDLQKSKDLATNSVFSIILKGFFLNAVNPGVLFYWLTIIGTLRDKERLFDFSENTTVIIYLIVILSTFILMDIFKIFGAKKLKSVLTPAWMSIINKAIGIILICFGALFIFDGLYYMYNIL